MDTFCYCLFGFASLAVLLGFGLLYFLIFRYDLQNGEPMTSETFSTPRTRQEYIEQCKQQVPQYLSNYHPVMQYLCNKDLTGIPYRVREENSKVGVLVAFKTGQGTIYIGISKSHSKKEKFNKYVGVVKAFKKVQPLQYFDMSKVHPSARAAVTLFLERVRKYYKV